MVLLQDLHSAFPKSGRVGRFFHDTGSISLDADTALSVGYVLSTQISDHPTKVEEQLEPVPRGVLVDDCAAVSVGALNAPRIEMHIGFLVGATIADTEQIIDCIAAAFPVLRIVTGGEHYGVSNGEQPTVSVAIAVGAPSIRSDALLDTLATLNRNGRVVAAGERASMHQSPYEGIMTVARLRLAQDCTLQRGQLVLTGSMHRSVAVAVGDHFRADVMGLGSVCIRCVS